VSEPWPKPLPPRLVLYDGVCGLCDATVQFLLDHDPQATLHFATLQGALGQAIIGRHAQLAGVDSVVLVESGSDAQGIPFERVFCRSRAVFRILGGLDRRVRWLGVAQHLPAGLANVAYDLVASVRYRIWGKLDACRIPSPEVRARFHG